MKAIHRKLIFGITILNFSFLTGNNIYSQEVGEQNRPSISIVYLDIFGGDKLDYSNFDFDQSSLSSRAFIDQFNQIKIADLNIDPETLSLIKGNDVQKDLNVEELSKSLVQYFNTSKFGNQIVKHQFQVDDNFVWSNDLLNERSLYSQTEREARSTLNSALGAQNEATKKAFEGLARTYLLVIFPNSVEGNDTKYYTFNSNSILLKIDYQDDDDVITNLSQYYCNSDCSEQKSSFENYTVPIISIDGAKGGLKTSSAGESLNDFNLLEQVLSKSIDLVVASTPALQLTTYVYDIKPITAKVGLKEGVKVGRRYEVVRRTINQDNEVINKTRGYVRAKSVVDNRQNIVNVDDTGEQVINEFDPSTFVQVHGIGISPRDVMIESVDFGLLVNPYIAFGAYNSFGADIMYRVPNTLNIHAGLTIDVSGAGEESTANFWTDNFGLVLESTKTILIQAGLGGKIDLYVANGNFRLTPKFAGIYNLAQFISEDPISMEIINTYEPSMSTIGAKAGADFSFQFKESVGIYGGLIYTYLPEAYEVSTSVDDPVVVTEGYSDYFKNKGIQLNLGIRIGL